MEEREEATEEAVERSADGPVDGGALTARRAVRCRLCGELKKGHVCAKILAPRPVLVGDSMRPPPRFKASWLAGFNREAVAR
jgi:hypothetical protein